MRQVIEQRSDLARPVVECSAEGALELGDAYWSEIERVTLGLVRARSDDSAIELVLAGVASLLRFGAPETRADRDRVECRFPIAGGLLAKRAGGSLTLAQELHPGLELVVSVEDYSPRLDSGGRRGGLRSLAYRQLQQRAHRGIGRRYLAHMARRAS